MRFVSEPSSSVAHDRHRNVHTHGPSDSTFIDCKFSENTYPSKQHKCLIQIRIHTFTSSTAYAHVTNRSFSSTTRGVVNSKTVYFLLRLPHPPPLRCFHRLPPVQLRFRDFSAFYHLFHKSTSLRGFLLRFHFVGHEVWVAILFIAAFAAPGH